MLKHYPTKPRPTGQLVMSDGAQECTCGSTWLLETDSHGRLDATDYGKPDSYQVCADCGAVYPYAAMTELDATIDATATYDVASPEFRADLHAYCVAVYGTDWQLPGDTVHTVEDLEALPAMTVLLAFNGSDTPTVLQANALKPRTWAIAGQETEYSSEEIAWMLPAHIAWTSSSTPLPVRK